MRTFVSSRLGELGELTPLWSRDLGSLRDHVDARVSLLGFSPLTIHYVLSSWDCFISLPTRYEFMAVFALRHGLLHALTAFQTTCYMISQPVSHHFDLSYVSTVIQTTRYTISHPTFITGIYHTPRRPPTQLMIFTFSLYACYTPSQPFTFTTPRPLQQRSISYFLHLYSRLFPYFTSQHSGNAAGGQLLVVLPTGPEDQRQIQPDLRGSATDYMTGADWVMGWIYFLTAYFPWIYVMGNERWDTRLAVYVFSFWVLNLLYHRAYVLPHV